MTASIRTDTPLGAAARLRWTIADAWTLTQRGLRHWVRQPAQVVGGMAFMVMLVALYAFLFGGAMQVPGGGSYLEYLMPGMFVMTMAFGIGETMAAMSADAERGVTDRFRSMPISSAAVVVGRSATDMIYASLGLAVMVVAGYLLGWRFHGTGAEFAAAIGLLLLLRFALLWVGIVMGLYLPGPDRGEPRLDAPVPARDGDEHVRAARDDARLARRDRRMEPAVGDRDGHARALRQPGRGEHVLGDRERDAPRDPLAAPDRRDLPALRRTPVSAAAPLAGPVAPIGAQLRAFAGRTRREVDAVRRGTLRGPPAPARPHVRPGPGAPRTGRGRRGDPARTTRRRRGRRRGTVPTENGFLTWKTRGR